MKFSSPSTEALSAPSLSKQYIKIAVMMVGFLCLAYTLRHSLTDLKGLPPPGIQWLFLSIALFQMHYLIQAFAWHFMLSALGQKCPLPSSLRMYYLSLIARWLPGRIWYTATRIYLGREVGVSAVAVTFAMLLELTYILVGGMLVTLSFAGTLLPGFFGHAEGKAVLIVVALAILTFATVITRPDTKFSLLRWNLFKKALKRISGEEVNTESLPVMPLKLGALLLLLYTCMWIFSGYMFGVIGRTFIPMNAARWQACMPAFAGSWLVGFFSVITPAGLGTREGVMMLMLKPVMPTSYAAILTIASRVGMFGSELLGIALVCGTLRLIEWLTGRHTATRTELTPSPESQPSAEKATAMNVPS